ncbi:MAG: cohesin domain-containing protein [Isosphaeraceae bacterium]
MINTTGTVTIGGLNAGFTLQSPPPMPASGPILSVLIRGNSAPVNLQDNVLVGLDGVGNPFDIGVWSYSTQPGGSVNLQGNTFEKMWQGVLLEIPRGGATVQGNTFTNLKPSTFNSITYEPQGIFALSYGGGSNDISSGISITANTLTNFSGLPISVSGGYPGQLASKFTNVQITNNLIDAIGFLDVGFRAGVVLINDADTAGDAPNGGVANANVQGNLITAMTDCSAGTRGVWILGVNNNVTVQNNFISNFDRGVSIEENYAGSGFATNVTVTRNSLTNNVKSLVNASPNLVNAERNWWGTNDPALVKAHANGGVNVDYNPWIGSSTDTSIAAGFQPDLANLRVDSLTISGDDSVLKNTVYTLNLNTLALPGGIPLTSWNINWGDASNDVVPGASTFFNHTYTSAGNFLITATASDGVNTYTLSNTVSVAVTNFATLQVIKVTPNPSGFAVRFNDALDTNVLNLYTSLLAANTLGAPDVTLVGNVVGNVLGSLVVDPDNKGFTFVKTGGPLATDTYTITLRSDATNGIRTGGGAALDGNADNTAGDNFTTSFGASLAARTVSLPDFARGPGQPVILPAATGVALPISVSSSTSIVTLDLVIRYDPTKLTVNSAVVAPGLPAGTSLAINNLSPGLLILCLRSPSPLGPGLNELIRLNAVVPGGAGYTSKEVIQIESASINDGGIAVTADNAMHVVGFLGDTSGNGAITGLDAALANRVASSIDTGFSAYQMADPLLLADVNLSGNISGLDAVLINRFAASIPTPQIPNIPGGGVTVTGPDPLVSLPRDLTVAAGGSVLVPVNLLHTDKIPIGMGAVDLAISFDPAAFTVKGVKAGSLTGDFDTLWSVDADTGLIVFSSNRIAKPLGMNPGDSGTLAVIELVARPGATLGKQTINLLDSVTSGGGPRQTRLNDGQLLLVPAPTNAADDPVDGIVTIRPRGPKETSPIGASDAPIPQAGATVDKALEFLAGTPVAERKLSVDPAIVVIPPVADEPLEIPFRTRARRWPAQAVFASVEKMRGLGQ